MNDLSGLNAEEMLQEMEQMLREREDGLILMESLQRENGELKDQVKLQMRQIRQLTDYAEALNKENSEEGVKKLKETISRLTSKLESQRSETGICRNQIQQGELEIERLRRKAAIAEAERDSAQRRLSEKPMVVETTQHIEKDSCKHCVRKQLDEAVSLWRTLELRSAKRWKKNMYLLFLLIFGYLVLLADRLCHGAFPKTDFLDVSETIFYLVPGKWPGWTKVAVVVFAVVILMVAVIAAHHTYLWNWKDDVAYGLIGSLILAFSDPIRKWIGINLVFLLLLLLSAFIVGKLVINFLSNKRSEERENAKFL